MILKYKQAPRKPLTDAILRLMRERQVLPGAVAAVADEAFGIIVEEKVLRKTLPGYAEYMEQVRDRLVPFLWWWVRLRSEACCRTRA